MKLEIHLTTEERTAVRKLADVLGGDMPDAAKTAMRSWLIKNGYLDSAEADNDNQDEETRDEG